MICFLFRFAKSVSATQTKVYEEFTRMIIQRYLAHYENCKALASLNELDDEYKKYFKDLCNLAYEMTIKSKQVISAQELQVQLGGSGSLSEERGLGLLSICPTLYQTGIHQSYAFLHLTFQEFLTAYYIANYMEVSQQLNILDEYFEMETVWLFYSGLADLEKAPKILDKLFRPGMIELQCRYALESQNKSLSDRILKSGLLIFDKLRPFTDFLSVEHVIKTSSLPIIVIIFFCSDHDHNGMRALLQQLHKANLQQLVFLDIGVISDDETNCLCEVLQTATNITRLYLGIKHTRSGCAIELALQINHCTKLSELRLYYIGTPECTQTFISSLSPSTSFLELSFQKLDSLSIKALGNGLQHLRTNMLELSVVFSDINEDDMTYLVDGLQNIKSLRLNLLNNNIDSSGVTLLAERLSTLKLTGLILCNNIGPNGATTLAGGIMGLTKLYDLNLSHNNFGPNGAITLAGGLQYLTELRRFNLSRNNIDVAAAKAVLTSLKKCDHLYHLIIDEPDDYHLMEIDDGFIADIVIRGIVSPDETDTISELVEAVKHENKTRVLELGFRKIIVPPRTQVPTVVEDSPATEVPLPS